MELQRDFVRLLAVIAVAVPIAATAKPAKKKPLLPPPPQETGVTKAFMDADRAISQQIDRIAEGLDVFLARQSTSEVKNRSRVVLENSTFSSEGQGVKNSTHVKVSLHLPNLEESWQLKFTSYDEEEEERDTKNRYLRETPHETNYGTSVVFFRKLGKVKTTFQPRIVLGRKELKISHLLKFESESNIEKWIFKPKIQFFARPDKGTGVFTAANFSLPLSEKFSLNQINECEYEDHQNRFSVTHGISLGQGISKNSGLAYSYILSSNNRPTYHLDGHSFSISWNHLLYKNVLHYQVVPHITFGKSNHYKGYTGAILNVSLIF